MEKVLVMGGSYFIGKHVVDYLKSRYDVTVLNRGSHPLNQDNVQELIADRNNDEQMTNALNNKTFDYVVDISCFNQTQANILLQHLALKKLKKYIFISTSAVYDIHAKAAPYEENDPVGGDSPFKRYAFNKIKTEQTLKNTLPSDKLVVFRPPFVYGEDNYILRERLIFKMIEDEKTIYIPKTNNTIQFVYVKDLAQNIVHALNNKVKPGIYNVGNRKAVTFTEWVHLCEKVVGKKATIQAIRPSDYSLRAIDFFPFFAYDNVLNVEKIKQYDQTETSLIDGLNAAYADYLKKKASIFYDEDWLSNYQKIH